MTFLSTLSLRRATKNQGCNVCPVGFLSTLSLRRATYSPAKTGVGDVNFYPRSPCGERPDTGDASDVRGVFLSTLSLRRATENPLYGNQWRFISIHALLAESDWRVQQVCKVWLGISIHALLAESDFAPIYCTGPESNFYPRSPCGERRARTLPALPLPIEISIHALLAESDRQTPGEMVCGQNFYPRSPCGERPYNRQVVQSYTQISIHALLAESDHASM